MPRKVFIASTVSRKMSSHTKWPQGLPLTKSLWQPFIGLKHVNQLLTIRCTSFLPCGTFSWEYTNNIPCSLIGPQWSHHPHILELAQNRNGGSQREFWCAATESSPQAWIFVLGPREEHSAGLKRNTLPYHAISYTGTPCLRMHMACPGLAWKRIESQRDRWPWDLCGRLG